MSPKLSSPIRDSLPVAGTTERSRNQHPRTLAMLRLQQGRIPCGSLQVHSGGGYYLSEATTSGALDRVIYRWVDSSYLTGYTLRRPNNVCCDPTVEMCPVVADPMGPGPQ